MLNDGGNPTKKMFLFIFILWKNSNAVELVEIKTKVNK